MLAELHIQGFAIIEQIDIEFQSGLTIITGETGAGKSLLLGAVRLLLGERASSDLVASDRTRARVQGIFEISQTGLRKHLEQLGLTDSFADDQLVLRREILAGGGSRHYINDAAVTLGRLDELGRHLVAIHGQNDQALLLQPREQLELLDAFGQCQRDRDDYATALAQALETAHRLEHLLSEADELEKMRDFLRYQLREIDAAKLHPDEDKELEIELARLRHASRIFECVGSALDLLYEGERVDGTASQRLAEAESSLAEVARFDPKLEDFCRLLSELRISLESLGGELRAYQSNIEMDPGCLALLEERAQLIRNLRRKYGTNVQEILATRERLAAELQELENYEVNLAHAQKQFGEALAKLKEVAQRLSEKRRAAAKRFQQRVQEEMAELSLPGAQFLVMAEPRCEQGDERSEYSLSPTVGTLEKDMPGQPRLIPPEFGPAGIDRVEFYALMNVGDEPRPLRRVASGGELSRIMLAIECVLAERDAIPTLVFDEVDAGISGQAAEKVGRKLLQLARSHQVICITHLPQIAACGHQHVHVEKTVQAGRTRVEVRSVAGAQREQVIAHMLSGQHGDEASTDFARRLLKRSLGPE
jgi:DNA repair protein RecN (Recombination protein N)